MNIKRYFVTVNTAEIREVSIPDDIEFEIMATQEDILEIQTLFSRMDQEEKSGLAYIVRPFNENIVDDKRDQYNDDLIKIYELLYRLGTEETKESIVSMKILNN